MYLQEMALFLLITTININIFLQKKMGNVLGFILQSMIDFHKKMGRGVKIILNDVVRLKNTMNDIV